MARVSFKRCGVLGHICLLKQPAVAVNDVLNELHLVFSVRETFLHELYDLVGESNVVVTHDSLAAFHAVNDALTKLVVHKKLFRIFNYFCDPVRFLLNSLGVELRYVKVAVYYDDLKQIEQMHLLRIVFVVNCLSERIY